MNVMNREALWRRLCDAGFAEGDVPAPSASPSPWYVRTMLGVAGWIGAFFLLGFVAAGLAFVFESDMASLLVGAACCGAAYAIFLRAGKYDLASQFALAVSLAGQVMVVAGLSEIVDDGRDNAALPLAIAVFEAALALAIPSFIHRVWSTLASMVALGYALHLLGLPGSATGAVAAAFAVLWLREPQWIARSALWRPIGFGLAFSLLQFDIVPMVVGSDYLMGYRFGLSALWVLWIGPVLVAAVFMYTITRLLEQHGVAPNSRPGVAVLGAAVAVALATLKAPGVTSSLLILLLGFAGGNRTLFGVGVVGMLGYLAHFYYSLHATLLVKSAVLACTGLVLIAAWAGARWLFGPAPGKETRSETSHA